MSIESIVADESDHYSDHSQFCPPKRTAVSTTSVANRMILVVLTAVSLLVAPCTAGYVFLYDTGYREDGFKRYYVGPAQRCYSFSCWSDEVSYVSYQQTQHNTWMIFYEKPGCQGKWVSHFGHSGSLWFSESEMDNKISSMMVWESGMYPTRGMVDLCPEESAMFLKDDSMIDGNSGSHDSSAVVGSEWRGAGDEAGMFDAANFTTRE